jgi:extracellular factor (EF) 3-hydroxypalmitic acid methyl ester biosynthesis protein
VSKLAQSGSFDLVLAGGLFDYLPERPANFLIRTVCDRLLAPKGRFFFTNLGQNNPYRVWMEYMANWQLIERSKSELLDMVASASNNEAVCSIAPDPTGLTWLVTVDKP